MMKTILRVFHSFFPKCSFSYHTQKGYLLQVKSYLMQVKMLHVASKNVTFGKHTCLLRQVNLLIATGKHM
jgi:hypothetical protein